MVEAFYPLLEKHEIACNIVKNKNEKYFMNLSAINKRILMKHGVLEEHVEDCAIDTMRTEHFFSYRRDCGKTGRHAAVISLL